MTLAFISFQHYKYQQENNKKIANIEKYIRVLSKEFTDLKLELEEYEEPTTDVKVSKYNSININENNEAEDDEAEDDDETEKNEELEIEGMQEVNIGDIPSEDEIKNLLQNSIFTKGATVMMGGDAQFMFQSNLDSNLSDPEITEITDIKTDTLNEIESKTDNEENDESDESAFTKDSIQVKTVQELKEMIIAKSGKLNWKLKKKAELVDEVVRLHNLAS